MRRWKDRGWEGGAMLSWMLLSGFHHPSLPLPLSLSLLLSLSLSLSFSQSLFFHYIQLILSCSPLSCLPFCQLLRSSLWSCPSLTLQGGVIALILVTARCYIAVVGKRVPSSTALHGRVVANGRHWSSVCSGPEAARALHWRLPLKAGDTHILRCNICKQTGSLPRNIINPCISKQWFISEKKQNACPDVILLHYSPE